MIEDNLDAYRDEFEAFWERLVALPPELSTTYDVCSVLSEGNGKTTCLVTAKKDGQRYILKTADLQCKESLKSEYALLEALSGGSFPRAIAYAQNDCCQYLLRQYVEGVTLDQYVAEHGVFSELESARIAYNLCNALETLHSMKPPVIHRDIKPQNVIFTPEKSCVLIDLGAARRFDVEAAKDTTNIGSVITAAPEQYGYRQTDVRSDIYALGVLLLFLCTGSYDLGRCCDIQNPRLAAIIRRCTRFDPDDRYPSIRPVQLGLSRVLTRKVRWYTSFPAGLALGLVTGAALCFFAMRTLLPSQANAQKTLVLPVTTIETTETPNLQPVLFSSPLVERAVRKTLGMDAATPIYESDLEKVTQLMIFGDTVYSDWDTFIHDVTYRTPEGNGTLFSMDDVVKLPNLHMLGIVDQKIFDISILKQTVIETLALSNNLITDLSPLTEMPCLSKLYVKGNPISDISPLSAIPTLTLLDIGNTPVIDLSPIGGSNLQTVWMNDTPIADYSPLLSMPQLKTLWVSQLDAKALSICSQLTRLNSLSIYKTPLLTNLAPLTNLSKLTFLDLVGDGIQNIDGVERFSCLYYLCLMGNPITDFSPLTISSDIRSINITYLDIEDYSFLTQLPSLKSVYCDKEQGEMIRTIHDLDKIELIVG